MDKILPIVGTALSLVAVVVSVLVLLQVNGMSTTIEETITSAMEASAIAADPSAIPLTELTEFNMEDNFILTYPSDTDPDDTVNVVLKVGFAIHTTDDNTEEYTAATNALTNQGTIIRDQIQHILMSKDVTYFKDPSKEAELKQEILEMVQTKIGNAAVVDVYFISPLIS